MIEATPTHLPAGSPGRPTEARGVRGAYLRLWRAGFRWLYLLEGEAHLARGSWSDAVRPLTNAVAAARLEDDPSAIARALTSLGRAHYRRGAWDDAKPHLEEALNTFDPSDPLRASAIRALADIRLRHGDLRGAEAMWSDALDAARLSDSSDAQSRAIRGLANVRALQNRLDAAASLLESALDRLERGGDVRVLCSVLGRAVELDLAAGRLGAANHRVERLLERVQTHELADRLADAHALHAIAALCGLFYVWTGLRAGWLVISQLATVGVLWYFVVGIWPVIFGVVYLS